MTTAARIDGIVNTTISGGGHPIDLRNLNGVDGVGLRIQTIRIENPAASSGNVSLATGASNGRAIPGTIVVPPGGTTVAYLADYGVDIDATHKTLDVTGTNGDTPIITIELA